MARFLDPPTRARGVYPRAGACLVVQADQSGVFQKQDDGSTHHFTEFGAKDITAWKRQLATDRATANPRTPVKKIAG